MDSGIISRNGLSFVDHSDRPAGSALDSSGPIASVSAPGPAGFVRRTGCRFGRGRRRTAYPPGGPRPEALPFAAVRSFATGPNRAPTFRLHPSA
jgi:hypothetical protein